MAIREYARFVEDAVLCRRVERAKTRVRELSALINGPRDVSARVGVGESRIRSMVATRQRGGFGSQSYNSGKLNTRTSYGSGVDGPYAKQRGPMDRWPVQRRTLKGDT